VDACGFNVRTDQKGRKRKRAFWRMPNWQAMRMLSEDQAGMGDGTARPIYLGQSTFRGPMPTRAMIRRIAAAWAALLQATLALTAKKRRCASIATPRALLVAV